MGNFTHGKLLLFLCFFSIVYALFFASIHKFPLSGDEATYYAYGLNLYRGNGYSFQESAPFTSSNLREPAYAFFISGIFKIFGASKSAVQIAQAALNGIIVVITYCLAKLIFNSKTKAMISSSLVALSPSVAGYASFIASETLAVLCLVAVFLFFLLFLKERNTVRAIGFSILLGIFYGCLVLAKMVYLFLIPLICFLLIIAPKDKCIKYAAICCVIVIFVGMFTPWLCFNKRIYGNPFFLTNRSGITTTIKAERLKWTPKDIFVSFIYPVSDALAQKFFPREYKKIAYEPLDGSAFKTSFDKYNLLIAEGYSEMTADKQLRVEALRKIWKNIPKYILLSLSDFHFMLYFEGLPLSQYTDFFKRQARMGINFFFKLYSLLIVFFAFKGVFSMMRCRKNIYLKIVFLLPIVYTFFMYSAIFGAPRYTFTVIPFIYILAAVGIYEIMLNKLFKIRIKN